MKIIQLSALVHMSFVCFSCGNQTKPFLSKEDIRYLRSNSPKSIMPVVERLIKTKIKLSDYKCPNTLIYKDRSLEKCFIYTGSDSPKKIFPLMIERFSNVFIMKDPKFIFDPSSDSWYSAWGTLPESRPIILNFGELTSNHYMLSIFIPDDEIWSSYEPNY